MSRGAEWQISSSAPARAGITFGIWQRDCAAGLQGFGENRGVVVVSFFPLKRAQQRHCSAMSCMERLDPSHALSESNQECLSPKHNCWHLGFALLLSLMHTKPCKKGGMHCCSQTDIFPVISKRLY